MAEYCDREREKKDAKKNESHNEASGVVQACTASEVRGETGVFFCLVKLFQGFSVCNVSGESCCMGYLSVYERAGLGLFVVACA